MLVQSSSTRTDANENQVKFCSQQNFFGASKLNSVAAFTLRTEINGDFALKHKKATKKQI